MRADRLTICIDFDGVICEFKGWVGEFTFGEPKWGAFMFLLNASDEYRIVIHTARPDIAEVWKWLNKHGMSDYVDDVTNIKPPAHVYIDDRAIQFNGSFDELLDAVKNFKPYWKS